MFIWCGIRRKMRSDRIVFGGLLALQTGLSRIRYLAGMDGVVHLSNSLGSTPATPFLVLAVYQLISKRTLLLTENPDGIGQNQILDRLGMDGVVHLSNGLGSTPATPFLMLAIFQFIGK